jgi:hypothetical protein
VLTATSVADSTVAAAASITLAAPPAPTPSAPLNLGEASVPEGFGIPVIATDAAGNVDVAWINQPGPEFVRSINGGPTFSAWSFKQHARHGGQQQYSNGRRR